MPELTGVHDSEALFSTFDVDSMPSASLRWQTGYLTFVGQRQTGTRIEYTLTTPKLEVRAALHDALLKGMMDDPMPAERAEPRLMANDSPGLQAHFTRLFAGLPCNGYRNNPIVQYAGYYASVFYRHFAARRS